MVENSLNRWRDRQQDTPESPLVVVPSEFPACAQVRSSWLVAGLSALGVVLGHCSATGGLRAGVEGGHGTRPPASRLHQLRQGGSVRCQVLGHAYPGTVPAEAGSQADRPRCGLDASVDLRAADAESYLLEPF